MRSKNAGQRRVVTPEAAMVRLETLCARSEQCVSEIRRKLAAWQVNADDASRIVDSLVQRRFVDDSRYARAYVRDKYRFARWGRRKIEMGLRTKRISGEIIRETLADIDSGEYLEILRHILKSKAATMTDSDTYEGRTRLFRFAAARGFEPDIVASAIRAMTATSKDSDPERQ